MIQARLLIIQISNYKQLSETFFWVCMKRITLCNCLCSSSCFSASRIRNIGEFGVKNNFTDHRTANTIYVFRDSFSVLKIHGCYQNSQKFEQLSIQAMQGEQLQCVDVNNPLQTAFKPAYTIYTYSNCMINQLLNYLMI